MSFGKASYQKRAQSKKRAAVANPAKIKLLGLYSSDTFNRSLKWVEVLVDAASESIIRLNYPETLIVTPGAPPKLLANDRDGVLRVRSGARLVEQFFFLCGEEHKKAQKATLFGYRFPEYIVYGENGKVELTIGKRDEVNALLEARRVVVQRFVVPRDFIVQRLVVRWRRTKSMKVFTVSSQLPMKASSHLNNENETLDLAFLASTRFLGACDIRKEVKPRPEAEVWAKAAREILDNFVLRPGEVLEELLFSLIYGVDGKPYLLNCSRAKVVSVDTEVSHSLRRRGSLDLDEVVERVAKPLNIRPCVKLSKSVLSDCPLMTHSLPHLGRAIPIRPVPSFISDHLDSVAASMDQLSQQAWIRKQVTADSKQRMRFTDYPSEFLTNCIHRMYTHVTADPHLCHYFRLKEKRIDHIRQAMKEAFLSDRNRRNIREIHRSFHISDRDFNLFVRHFEKALECEGGKAEDISSAIAYLASFKSSIVSYKSIGTANC